MSNKNEKTPIDLGGNYVLNPNYGGGAYRRHIRLVREGNTITGELEDCNHGFKVKVEFAGKEVTAITPMFPRVPFTTCNGAETPLKNLIGVASDTSVPELNAIAKPLENCTHLLDLTLMAITHQQQTEDIVLFDIEVGDQVDGEAALKVWRNEKLIHDWKAAEAAITWPENLVGKPLFRGFAAWANEAFEGIEKEAAFALHKGNLVAIGRFLDVDALAGNRAIDENDRVACYTYSLERSSEAIRLPNTTRDFTHTPEELLQFK